MDRNPPNFDGDQKKGLLQSYLESLRQADPTLDIYAVGDPASAMGAFRPRTPSKLSPKNHA
jgi:hypothetical protein